MKLTNIIHPRFISTVAVVSSVIGLGLFPNSEAFAITFGQGGEFPWTSPLIQPNGTAHPVNTTTADGLVMRLTDDVGSEAGSAFFKNNYVLGHNSDFSTSFDFRITSARPGIDQRADGLAFVIGTSPSALGANGGSLGYGAPGYDGSTGGTAINPSVIVEFDTFHNSSDPNSGDPNGVNPQYDPTDSHVAVMKNGNEQNHLIWSGTPSPIDNGDKWQVLINYFGQGNLLIVNLSDLDNSGNSMGFSYNIDIPNIMGCGTAGCVNSYFGFTAATGARFSNQDILSWSLAVPEPGSLILLGSSQNLPKILR